MTTREVPYLTNEAIEADASLLLAEFARDCRLIAEPPVPIDEIIEIHLRLTFEIGDLRSLFGLGDVHGAIWFRERRIVVDRQLDPVSNPAKLGRYHFTLAHETGHWRLHRKLFLRDAGEANLFGDTASEPDHICRTTQAKARVERQADSFAACLLMPGPLVRREWLDWRGEAESLVLADLGERRQEHLDAEIARRPFPKQGKHADDEMVSENLCRPLADRFEVSAEAMRIRLEEMHLLLRTREPSLF